MNGFTGDLRRDLISWPDGSNSSTRQNQIVHDDISGRFAKISQRVWKAISEPQSAHDVQSSEVAEAMEQARVAGWTRQRITSAKRQFSPLYIRIPLISIDGLAKLLAIRTGWIFSKPAVTFWKAVITVAVLMIVSRFDQLTQSLARLPIFLTEANAWTIGLVFLSTKFIHELAHATMCRRVGARCGTLGVLLLCGVPCPYCDVTDVWRAPNARDRVSVMVAGIYVELIVASLATFVWCLSSDLWIQFHALNVVIVCGVSTLLFNANPLMRYDGYYVLSDFLNSLNLRRESRQSFDRLVTNRLFRKPMAAVSSFRKRDVFLSGYHSASVAYRILVMIALSAMAIGIADHLHLRSLAIAMTFAFSFMLIVRMVKKAMRLLIGSGTWQGVAWTRRLGFLSVTLSLFAALIFLIPIPRQCQLLGHIDAPSAAKVFLPADGVVDVVNADFGDRVREGEELIRVRDDQTKLDVIELEGHARVASLRSQSVRLSSLDSASLSATEAVGQWESLHAVETAIEANLAFADRQLQRVIVRSPTAGIVIPPAIDSDQLPSRNLSESSLQSLRGTRSQTGIPWCRVTKEGKLFAVLEANAVYRRELSEGTLLRINESQRPDKVYTAKIVSISAIRRDDHAVTRQASFRVLCEIPTTIGDANLDADFLSRIGGSCVAVADLPGRTLVASVKESLREWLR
ncbi:hypothetical protein N9N28_11940 [Rubripirellula amarantea]|nr:hypothetical protein [Rubripirellula amarantea]